MDSLSDETVARIFHFVPDAVSVCKLEMVGRRFRRLLEVHGETIWLGLLKRIPETSRPVREEDPYIPAHVVNLYASACLFAEQMEKLWEDHRSGKLDDDHPLPDCTACVPDYYPRRDQFFVRMTVKGNLLWQGFMKNGEVNESIFLSYAKGDLSEAFEWPEMNAYLSAMPPLNDGTEDGELNFYEDTYYKSQEEALKQLHRDLTLTVIACDGSYDRTLAISTAGLEETRTCHVGYCETVHLKMVRFKNRPNGFVAKKQKLHYCHENAMAGAAMSFRQCPNVRQGHVGKVQKFLGFMIGVQDYFLDSSSDDEEEEQEEQ